MLVILFFILFVGLSSLHQTSSYCGTKPRLVAAEPSDLNIVCSQSSIQVKPEAGSNEETQVLHLAKITNHPNYSPGTEKDVGADLKGPYAGGDIAVYHLRDDSKTKLKKAMKARKLWPACLPKRPEEYTSKQGIFAGWIDQEPFYRVSTDKISTYEMNYLTLRATQVQSLTICRLFYQKIPVGRRGCL